MSTLRILSVCNSLNTLFFFFVGLLVSELRCLHCQIEHKHYMDLLSKKVKFTNNNTNNSFKIHLKQIIVVTTSICSLVNFYVPTANSNIRSDFMNSFDPFFSKLYFNLLFIYVGMILLKSITHICISSITVTSSDFLQI